MNRRILAILFPMTWGALLLACGGEPSQPVEGDPAPASSPTTGVQHSPELPEARVPAEGWRTVDRDRLERERLEESWRASAERDLRGRTPAGSRAAAPTPAAGPFPVEALRAGAAPAGADAAAPGSPEVEAPPAGTGESAAAEAPTQETWEDIGPDAFPRTAHLPLEGDVAGPSVLWLQQRLDRAGFSPGIIDGRWGKNTEKAVYWLQDALGLPATGSVDRELWDRLAQAAAEGPVRRHALTQEDVAGPFVTVPDEPTEQAELDCLCYESLAEKLAERFHTTPELLAQLNRGVDLDAVSAGDELVVPDVEIVAENRSPEEAVARLVVSKGGRYLQALDEAGRILMHAPTVIGAEYDPSPEGEFEVVGVAYDPDFHFQPELMADVPDHEEDALLPPGPNSPVGLVWMPLSKENYGIHGTAEPATIGYTSSHGCVRLTNWDALRLANVVPQGVPVVFEP